MKILTVCIFAIAALAAAFILNKVFLSKHMQKGMRIFFSIISVVCCEILFILFGLCLSLKPKTDAAIQQTFSALSAQISQVSPGLMEQQVETDSIIEILEQADIGAQLDKATEGLNPAERFIIIRLVRSFFPASYSIDFISGTLRNLLAENAENTGRVSLSQIFSSAQYKISETAQSVLTGIQITLIIIFLLFTVCFIITAHISKPHTERINKSITFGDGAEF